MQNQPGLILQKKQTKKTTTHPELLELASLDLGIKVRNLAGGMLVDLASIPGVWVAWRMV